MALSAGVGRIASRLAGFALVVLLAIAASVPLVGSIGDPDFFWHLKTGDWIWEHASLPHQFLFSSTTPEELDPARRFTMTSYWAVQVLYHLVHATAGMAGIAVIRAVLLLLLVGSLLMRRRGKDALVFLATTLLVVLTTRLYGFERPQVFSFVFFSFLLLLLDRLCAVSSSSKGELRTLSIALPLLMVLWANCHGAFVLGQATILLYLVCEGAKFVHPALAPLPWERYRLLLIAGGSALAAAFINPNTWHPLLLTQLPPWQTTNNLEYFSSLEAFSMTREPVFVVFWFILGLAGLSVALGGRPDITRVALVATTAVLGWRHMRHTMFSLLCAAPLIEVVLSQARLRKTVGSVVVVGALAAGLYLAPGDIAGIPKARHLSEISPITYPVDAADFIEQAGVHGNLFNFSNWGGYLLWRLYPAKVFIDGRNSVRGVKEVYDLIETAAAAPSSAGKPLWKNLMATYRIRHVVLPIFDPMIGRVLPLTFALLADASWVPVWVGVNSLVFVETGPDNADLVARFAIPRGIFLNQLISTVESYVRSAPGFFPTRIALGDLLTGSGRTQEARRAYQEALVLAPAHPLAANRLAQLRAQRD